MTSLIHNTLYGSPSILDSRFLIASALENNATSNNNLLGTQKPPLGFIHSVIHSGHLYSASSSPLLLRDAPDYSTDSEFYAEAHRQLQVKGLSKVPTWRLELESNPRPSG